MAKNRKRAPKKPDGRRNRRAWTKQQRQELRAHARARTPVATISKLTKRTAGALRQEAKRLGLPLGHRH
jgi:hypothetical protein